MLEFYVNNQTLKMFTPVVAADTLHYLTGVVHFTGDEWDGYTKWIHFVQGDGLDATVYDISLLDDAFDESANLNLTIGEWSVYVTGTLEESRLTTVPVALTVKASGLIDAPLHVVPLSVAEQIDSRASAALSCARYVKDLADSGAFNGKDGQSVIIAGYYDTYADLTAAVTEPDPGEAYGVGEESPYDIYIWDAVNDTWINNGPIVGTKGDTGDDGVFFTPSVDASGNLSWTRSDGSTDVPATRNIRGPQGLPGPAGTDGVSPYTAAQSKNYTGTEDTLYAALAALPFHNARHLPTGADPILMKTGNIDDGQVTRPKLGADSVSTLFSAEIGTTWTASESMQTLSPDGATTDFTITAAPSSLERVEQKNNDEWETIASGYTYADGTLTFSTAPAAGTDTIRAVWLTAPYTQTVSVSGLLSTDKVLVDAVVPSNISQADAIMEAFAEVYKITVANNALTVYSLSATGTAVPISVLAVSK